MTACPSPSWVLLQVVQPLYRGSGHMRRTSVAHRDLRNSARRTPDGKRGFVRNAASRPASPFHHQPTSVSLTTFSSFHHFHTFRYHYTPTYYTSCYDRTIDNGPQAQAVNRRVSRLHIQLRQCRDARSAITHTLSERIRRRHRSGHVCEPRHGLGFLECRTSQGGRLGSADA